MRPLTQNEINAVAGAGSLLGVSLGAKVDVRPIAKIAVAANVAVLAGRGGRHC